MSTQFVTRKRIECPYCCGEGIDYEDTNIAHRVGRPNGAFITANLGLLDKLDDDERVYAIDNTPQGIYTIGDIKKHIKEQENK